MKVATMRCFTILHNIHKCCQKFLTETSVLVLNAELLFNKLIHLVGQHRY